MHNKIWLEAARPKTLGASIAPVITGTAMAYAHSAFHWLSAILALAGAVLIQVGTNYANDYFDYSRGADAGERLGPVRATQAGLVTPQAMRLAFTLSFIAASIAGLYLIYRGGIPILVIGILSIVFGFIYTGGPYPLGYYGFGDIFVLIFFGPVAVGGTYFVQALQINWSVVFIGFAPGLLSVAILTVNNLRDRETDKKAGKKTIAVRFGKRYTQYQYLLSVLLACIIPLILFAVTEKHPFSLISCFALLYAIKPIKTVFKEGAGAELNKTLAETGLLNILFALLFSIGWLYE